MAYHFRGGFWSTDDGSRGHLPWDAPPSPIWIPNPPLGIHGPGWADMISGNSSTATTSISSSRTGANTGGPMQTHPNMLNRWEKLSDPASGDLIPDQIGGFNNMMYRSDINLFSLF